MRLEVPHVGPTQAHLPSSQRAIPRALGLAPLGFVLLVLLLFSFRFRFELDTDEGVNAIKALLAMRGHPLYAEIWSDQPPLFTWILAAWLSVFGLNVLAGRVLVLLFAAALLWIAMRYLQRFWGTSHSAAGFVTVLTLPYYLRLSVSIMIGLPSIALAMLSFYGLVQSQRRGSWAWLVLSGAVLGLSVLTKLFTAFLAPLFVVALLIPAWPEPGEPFGQQGRWARAGLWLLAFGLVVGVVLLWVVTLENVPQLLTVHLNNARAPFLQTDIGQPAIQEYLSPSLFLLLLAGLGTLAVIRGRRWTALVLPAWSVGGYLLLAANASTWYHHQLLVTVPAAILAAIALGDALSRVLPTPRIAWPGGVLPVVTLALGAAFLFTRLPPTLAQFDLRLPNVFDLDPGDGDREMVRLISMYAPRTNWIFTDRPMFAFRAQLSVPPFLAVLTKKRLETGALTADQILAVLEEYRPEQILNARFRLPVLQEYMRTRSYRRVDSHPSYRLWVDIQNLSQSPPGRRRGILCD